MNQLILVLNWIVKTNKKQKKDKTSMEKEMKNLRKEQAEAERTRAEEGEGEESKAVADPRSLVYSSVVYSMSLARISMQVRDK